MVRVDAELAEQRVHAEGARLVGDDRHDQRGRSPCRSSGAAAAARAPCVVATSRSPLSARNSANQSSRRRRERRRRGRDALRHEAAERAAALAQILDLLAVVGRAVEGRLQQLAIGDRDAEAVAELAQLLLVQLLLLMGDVAALAGFAEAVALDRLGEDDGRRADVLDGGAGRRRRPSPDRGRRGAGAAAWRRSDPRPSRAAPDGCRRSACGCRRRSDTVYFWYWPSTTSPMRWTSRPSVSRGEQRIPVVAPDHLDDVPAGAAEGGLELLDDLAVAAHRPVEALQVAVDDPDQVVEVLARRERDGAQRLGLVGLAVAEERPDVAAHRCRAGRDRAGSG